jgi:hypothetical protein
VTLPAGATSAVLEWEERLRWDMLNFGGSTLPRTYAVRVEPAGGGPALATLYAASLEPGTLGDTGYVYHAVDVIGAGVPPGVTVDLVWRQDIPQTFTGPAQFEFDAVRFTCEPPAFLIGVNLRLDRDTPQDRLRDEWSNESYAARREAYGALRNAQDTGAALSALQDEVRAAARGSVSEVGAASARSGVVYDVLLDPFFPPTTPVCVALPDTLCGPLVGLLPGATYFWRVIRREGAESVAGPVWTFTTDQDCQPNGIPDNADILVGVSQDCDANFVPDECEHCFADINDDLAHDTADLGLILARFLSDDCFADLNTDGVVDTADLGILLGLFLVPCAPP